MEKQSKFLFAKSIELFVDSRTVVIHLSAFCGRNTFSYSQILLLLRNEIVFCIWFFVFGYSFWVLLFCRKIKIKLNCLGIGSVTLAPLDEIYRRSLCLSRLIYFSFFFQFVYIRLETLFIFSKYLYFTHNHWLYFTIIFSLEKYFHKVRLELFFFFAI